MSDETLKLFIAGALLLHGLGHLGAMGALIALDRGIAGGAWRPARVWLIPSLPAPTAKIIANTFWILSALGFVAAALSF